ncbi:Valyl/Leucyl/Isoleucyl-tRNA synthetase, class I, anticodon-binding domain protein, partial [mine drainage metagenome]
MDQLELVDRWLLSRLAGLVRRVSAAMPEFDLGSAVDSIYQFAWHELADWYLELVKDRLEAGDEVALWITRTALVTTVTLLHPIIALPHRGPGGAVRRHPGLDGLERLARGAVRLG